MRILSEPDRLSGGGALALPPGDEGTPQWQRLREWSESAELNLNYPPTRAVLSWMYEQLLEDTTCISDAQLDAGFQIGLEVYSGFNDAFYDTFHELDGIVAIRWVRKVLLKRRIIPSELVVESVIERIRGRWPHLWKKFSRKYQPSLWRPLSVERRKIVGYLRRVVDIESLKLPPEDLMVRCQLDEGRVEASSAKDDHSAGHELIDLIVAFWSDPNYGFTTHQRLEGLVSLGLGAATGEPILAERLKQFFQEERCHLAARQQRLLNKISVLLAKRDRIQIQVRNAARAAHEEECETLSTEAERIESRLLRTQARFDDLSSRYLPRPKEVAKLLEGFVHNQGGTRFRRIRREIEILKKRVNNSAAQMEAMPQNLIGSPTPAVVHLIAQVSVLPSQILQHLEQKPCSARGRQSETVTRSHDAERADWERESWRILRRTTRLLRGLVRRGLPSMRQETDVQNYLEDVEHLYRFGLLDRRGLMEALRNLNRGRLVRLLRVD